jgi:hypothetical protein
MGATVLHVSLLAFGVLLTGGGGGSWTLRAFGDVAEGFCPFVLRSSPPESRPESPRPPTRRTTP